ncbi:YcdB/YcdC domain-containing protein [Paenibacillus sp. FSL L8-0340]|uniref:YcdB/YcdC domain-containing protein n=1 Tax=Paenibacillus sp. FSL L8-0340 TaxID=2954685 RepID=UPI0031580ACB
MNSNSNQFIHQTAKAALITTVALALLLPAGFASAESGLVPPAASAEAKSGGTAASSARADAALAKITQDEAVAKLRELFPVLKSANVTRVQLGNNDYYSAGTTQMAWTIEWEYQVDSGGYGFSSIIDAVTGDLINTYINVPLVDDTAYYPPKLSRAEALEKARSFITAAMPSLKSENIQLVESRFSDLGSEVLFGPVQYSFNFNMLRNGIPSVADDLIIGINGNGEVINFNKMSAVQALPSAKPAISKEQAKKTFTDNFNVGLYYTPVYKNGNVASWILGWKVEEQALYSIDAHTGKRLDNEGKEASSIPVSHETVPLGKEVFQPLAPGKELTVEEAVKLVEKVAALPKDRKLVRQAKSTAYQRLDQKVWMLTWGADTEGMQSGMPRHSYAEINAVTGEITQFQMEQYMYGEEAKPQPVPAGSKKLTPAEAKQKALALVNRMYNKASSNLKLVEHGGTWSVKPDGKGYRYEFINYYQGIPVSGNNISIELDLYGGLQAYTAGGSLDYSKLTEVPAPAISKAEALQSYLGQYDMQLQFVRLGGYSGNGGIGDSTVKLVYAPLTADNGEMSKVLDANSGKWVSLYERNGRTATAGEAVDLKGHLAEKQLTELLKYKVLTLDEGGKVNPDQEISTGDWWTLIADASTTYYKGYSGAESKTVAGVSPESPYYDAINYAVNRGWISRDTVVRPESKLSREELAVQLSFFLKYGKLSSFLANDAVVSSFSDSAAINYKGAVALVVKLGLLEGENGKFDPQRIVTKAQAAIVIMKMVELQGKLDQPIV